MSDNTCSICIEPLLSSKEGGDVGTVVPCGHCFHANCFGCWKASQGNRTKCPNCNKPAKNFLKIFISLGEDANIGDDDDLSLSSVEQEEEEEGKKLLRLLELNSSDEDDDPPQSPLSQNMVSQSSPPDAAVVDLTMSPERSSPKRKRRRESIKDEDEGTSAGDMKKKAKRYKRLFLQKQSQCREQYKQQMELSQKIASTKEELESKDDQIRDLEAQKHEFDLELQGHRLQDVRLNNELKKIKEQYKKEVHAKIEAETKRKDLEARYKNDMTNARSESIAEVKDLLEDVRTRTEENNRLKKLLDKYKKEHGPLKAKVPPPNVQNKIRKKKLSITKELRQMDSVRSIPSYNEDRITATKEETSSHSTIKYSSQTARIYAAGNKTKRKPLADLGLKPPPTATTNKTSSNKTMFNLNFGPSKKKQKTIFDAKQQKAKGPKHFRNAFL